MRKLIVNNLKKNNNKLLYYIKENYPNLSSSILYKALRNKDIKINSKRINDPNYTLYNGDILEIFIDDLYLFGIPKNVTTLYEDENILIIFKPQGILSNNEDSNINEPTFEDIVQKEYGKNVKICHRLDRNTSGLLIFTKNSDSYDQMLTGFKEGYIIKEYIAYVYNSNFKSNHNIYVSYLLKDEKDGFSKIYTEPKLGAQKIITEIFVEKTDIQKNYAIVRVIIHTGKTHQIRSQLAYVSHPVIGDSKYGKNEINKKFKKYKQMLFAVKYKFNFPSNSTLNYLNNIIVKLNDDFYKDKL